MSAPSMTELVAQVRRLEQQNLRTRQFGIALACGVAVVFTLATNFGRRSAKFEAESFVLRDRQGNARATLTMRDGEPTLALFDDRGRDHLVLRSSGEKAAVVEFRNRGELRMALETASTGGSHLNILGTDDRLAAAIAAWPGGDAGLTLQRGGNGAHLTVSPDGSSRLGYTTGDGRTIGGWVLGDQATPVSIGVASEDNSRIRNAPSPINAASFAVGSPERIRTPAANSMPGTALPDFDASVKPLGERSPLSTGRPRRAVLAP